jgi:hypothetical protein
MDGYRVFHDDDSVATPLVDADAAAPSPDSGSEPSVASSYTFSTADSVPLPDDWNETYQSVVDSLEATTVSQSDFQNDSKLNDLITRFLAVVESEGCKIVDEVDLPDERKTVKPVDVGGVAGGTKYLSKGVFFKFVKDSSGIYGSDARAMKVAGLELMGLRAYQRCHIQGLHFPLMTLLDYRGHRLIASTMLPLSRTTLVYGSADGTSMSILYVRSLGSDTQPWCSRWPYGA